MKINIVLYVVIVLSVFTIGSCSLKETQQAKMCDCMEKNSKDLNNRAAQELLGNSVMNVAAASTAFGCAQEIMTQENLNYSEMMKLFQDFRETECGIRFHIDANSINHAEKELKNQTNGMNQNNSQEVQNSNEPSNKEFMNPEMDTATIVNSIPEDDVQKYKWEGTYSFADDDIEYVLRVYSPGPMRWTEFGWEMNVSGVQTYYKINGYGDRDDNGHLDIHYMNQVDGAFYQSDQMDMNETMFKLNKFGNVFEVIDGKWKASKFIKSFVKK